MKANTIDEAVEITRDVRAELGIDDEVAREILNELTFDVVDVKKAVTSLRAAAKMLSLQRTLETVEEVNHTCGETVVWVETDVENTVLRMPAKIIWDFSESMAGDHTMSPLFVADQLEQVAVELMEQAKQIRAG